jgi:hypothetical protein
VPRPLRRWQESWNATRIPEGVNASRTSAPAGAESHSDSSKTRSLPSSDAR